MLSQRQGDQMQAARESQMEEAVKPLSDIPAINRFLSYCRIRTVPSKTVVIHAGDLPDVLYYIISGSVEVMVEDEEGNEMVLAYLNKGQFFGEMGLFHESPLRSAWVRTRNHCELAEMTYPRFRQIAAESPGLVFELATQLATRLDRTNRKLSDLAFVDVTGRVAHAIMDLCGEPDAMTHPEGMQIKVSRQELSRLVGCSREMAGRVLKVLEDQGLLRATGKTIVVFNARPKMKTRPVVVPVQGGKGSGEVSNTRVEDDDDETTRTTTNNEDSGADARLANAALRDVRRVCISGVSIRRPTRGMSPCARLRTVRRCSLPPAFSPNNPLPPASLVREGVTEKLTDHVWAIPDGSASLVPMSASWSARRPCSSSTPAWARATAKPCCARSRRSAPASLSTS